jgi:hypothetical protein
MTKDEKLQFIGDLAATVIFDIKARVDDMPEEWDGIELRRYIADKFEEQAFEPLLYRDQVYGLHRSRRLRTYQNERLTRNL